MAHALKSILLTDYGYLLCWLAKLIYYLSVSYLHYACKNHEIKISQNCWNNFINLTRELNTRIFQTELQIKSQIKIHGLSRHNINVQRKKGCISRYYKLVIYLKNSITQISDTQQPNLMPLNPVLVAKAMNSCWVLSFPPGFWVIIIKSRWVVLFIELLFSGTVGRIASTTITFPSFGIAL